MTDTTRPQQFMQRVLVAEDDYQLAEVLVEVLTYENCAVDVAANGMEALENLRHADYDAIVCDLMVPRLDGEALYEEVTRVYPYLANRILFISSQAALRGGVADFVYRTGNPLLEKPFDMEQFRAALKELFSR